MSLFIIPPRLPPSPFMREWPRHPILPPPPRSISSVASSGAILLLEDLDTALGAPALRQDARNARPVLRGFDSGPRANQSAGRAVEPHFHLPACYESMHTLPPGPSQRIQGLNMFYASARPETSHCISPNK
ncbi:hypothetical protein DFH09DRAFT_1334656 [Mycena vulgaris]|nr:hypothetical protein DFH09DRAFT_1334656 [Mycena vulgaris]